MSRETVYEYFHKRLAEFSRDLTAEQRTDLDGILWAMSQEIVNEAFGEWLDSKAELLASRPNRRTNFINLTAPNPIEKA